MGQSDLSKEIAKDAKGFFSEYYYSQSVFKAILELFFLKKVTNN